jgi:hypothetical protein
MIEENLKEVQKRINFACQKVGRKREEIVLVCVTKTVGVDEIRELLNLGITDIGESYVQDALSKYKQLKELNLGNRISWHMVGHLQKNKAKHAVRQFSLIHSVDNIELAIEINRCAQRIDKVMEVLVQVNTSGETSKFGIPPRELKNLINKMRNLTNIRIKGLMTIAPFSDDSEKSRPFFRKLRLLKEEINKYLLSINYSLPSVVPKAFGTEEDLLSTLSMGMTQDFEVAIEEGANMLRIGRAIFEG